MDPFVIFLLSVASLAATLVISAAYYLRGKEFREKQLSCETLEAQEADLRSKIDGLRLTYDQLNDRLTAGRNQLKHLEALKQWADENSNLAEKLERQIKQSKQLDDTITDSKVTIDNLRKQQTGLTNDIGLLTGKQEALSRDNATLSDKVSTAEAKLAEMAPKLLQAEELENTIDSLRKSLDTASDELEKTTKANTNLKLENTRLEDGNRYLEEDSLRLKNTNDDLKQTSAHLEGTIEELRKDESKLRTDNAKLKEALRDQTSKIEIGENKLRTLNKNIDETNTRLDALKKDLQIRLDDIEESYKKREVELEKQYKASQADYNTRTQQLTDAFETAREAQDDKLDKLAHTFREREVKLEEHYRQSQSAYEAELTKTKTEREKALNDTIAAQKKQKEKELASEFTARRDELSTLDTSIADSRDRLNSLNEQIARNQGILTISEQEIGKNQQAAEDLGKKKNELEATISQLNGQLSGINATAKTAAQSWVELDTPITFGQTDRTFLKKSDPEARSEEKWLEEFQAALSAPNSGFHFNPRVIKAFHTGLKCNETSPLVVLAGISGTGKSLLPELYATYAGFNFLPIPVQPRWDSPQDLFGFYNYMERRYKATELSRLLWSMDSHNNPGHVTDTSVMNIVLLDEMNLARVEYYFSDFLSKLEQRRGIDPDNELQRRKAEIVLEGLSATPRQLYVGLNTIFVGTMNEDETTQMLSDKVVDRSNMLRFGRPSQLGAKPSRENFFNICDMRGRISSDIWNSWHYAKGTNDHPAVQHYAKELEELNATFAEVQRPFGHRIDQAVRNYLAQYPYESAKLAAYGDAFADQLEMKILPKLNGLEIAAPQFAGVRTKLDSVIAKTNDKDLAAAFEQACDPTENTFFKWRGVMR